MAEHHDPNASSANRSGIRRGYLLMLAVLLASLGSALKTWWADGSWEAFRDGMVAQQAQKPAADEDAAPGAPSPAGESATAASQQREQTPRAPHFSDPTGRMAGFFAALAALDAGRRRQPVRALYYGTSEIGYDRVTSQLRRLLQDRFGDGGKGFVAATPGWRQQKHQDILWSSGGDWEIFTLRDGDNPDGLYGLAGVAASPNGPAWLKVATTPPDAGEQLYHDFPAGSRASRFVLYYRTHPDAGPLHVRVDGDTVHTIDLGHAPKDRVFSLNLPDGPHSVRVDAPRASPAHIYGASLERRQGFTLDAAMVIGAWAHSFLNYSPEHIERQMALRSPELVIFQLGAKEIFRSPYMSDTEANEFARSYTQAIARIMSNADKRSCLVISPKDMGIRKRNLIITRPALPKIVAGARQAALANNCAFFNLYAAMGGSGTMKRWWNRQPRLVSPDLGHLYLRGAVRVGTLISDTLLEARKTYNKTTPHIPANRAVSTQNTEK